MALLDDLDPIFADCVLTPLETSSTRYGITDPWVVNGWVYATDGRILVRQRTLRKNTSGRFPPHPEYIFDEWTPQDGITITLPRIGRKRPIIVRCPNCRGRGQKCSCVDGKVLRTTNAIDLGCGDNGLADRYMWLLRDHGIKTVQPTTNRNCFVFHKDDIDGRLMGITLGETATEET